ncbi:carbohydrate sulfotransferase 5-like [Pseudophryne corroboree]|uniref:carbohydrate sulfotransferase 5-like n=1 Tax=Pseudophryne corroboree TaxID=495146 RepID=UPI00308206F2
MSRYRNYTIAIVIIFQTILIFSHLGTYIQPSTKQEPPKVHLLILSTWRSGSSLVGHFFSQHPDVFYIKEPGWHVWHSMFQNKAHVLQMAVRDLIRSLYKCDMSVFDAYMQNRSQVLNLFRWTASRALCSPPACDSFARNDIVPEAACRKQCGHYSFQKIEDACYSYSHMVIQENRIFDLKVLISLLKDPTLNLKIIHVVHDPRAVAKSREKTKRSLAFDSGIIHRATKPLDGEFKVLQEICQNQVNIYRTINSKQLFSLRDRYMLLRYDDLVRDPLKKARKVFSFINLKLTENLSRWIYNITHGDRRQKVNSFQIIPRDAVYTSQAWRNLISLEKVNKVQDICKEAMNTFRYQFIDTKEELRNLSMDSVLPGQRDDFMWLPQKKNLLN